jgi:hypothetical protein
LGLEGQVPPDRWGQVLAGTLSCLFVPKLMNVCRAVGAGLVDADCCRGFNRTAGRDVDEVVRQLTAS